MTEKVAAYRAFLLDRGYRESRRHEAFAELEALVDTDTCTASADRLCAAFAAETPRIYPHDDFGFHRTIIDLPPVHSVYMPKNVTPYYAYALEKGFDGILADIRSHETNELYAAMEREIKALYAFCARYRDASDGRLHDALCRLPQSAPQSFYEACVMMKLIIFTLRLNRNHHMTLGRFDQYMLPFWSRDLAAGVSRESLLETLELFFLSLNTDADLYNGIQQGDNGQSLVLGGYTLSGEDQYNGLSEAVIEASIELKVIDPKINLRVNRATPIERYEFATRLTKCGLGFPQYCNDDVVVPGLIKLGYKPEHAQDYAVAACWEFITNGNSSDVVNIANITLAQMMADAVREDLTDCADFEAFKQCVFRRVRARYDELIEHKREWKINKSPFLSIFTKNCIETGRDISEGGAVYYNWGFLTSGFSTCVDSLAAVKKAVFDEKYCTAAELVQAVQDDFEGHGQLRNYLLGCPKLGNNDDYADSLAVELLTAMEYANGLPNGHGGICRASTGSAMGYIRHGITTPATPDGRRAFTPFSSSFAPSPGVQVKGPLSVIASFTKYDLTHNVGGGPLTMEIHDTVFRNEDGVKKTAALVKAFIDRGGHQLQLNAVNRDVLLDAKAHPENHRNLIVRVWGWSGYFVELDPAYQDHIIARAEYRF